MSSRDDHKLDVFFYEAFREEEEELRTLLGNTCAYDFSPLTVQELHQQEPPARLISIRTQSKIPTDWSTQLGGVLSRSTGYDHLVAYRAKIAKSLPMGFLDEYATRAVAEQAILLSLALLRKLPDQMEKFKSFQRDGLTGFECPGKNMLVVGVGRIGSEICRIGSALGFVVRGVDIVPRNADVAYLPKEEGIAWADVIICAMNLTDENRGYFSDGLLRRAKRGAILVNIARGEHTPVKALTTALAEKILGGVGLDVYDDEGTLGASLRDSRAVEHEAVRAIHGLAEYPNVILTPHNAFNTLESVKRKSQMSVEQVKHFLRHKDFIWKIG